MKYKKSITVLLLVFLTFQLNNSVLLNAQSLFPVISNIVFTPSSPSSEDYVTVYANISFSEGLKEVSLVFKSESETSWNTLFMKNYYADTFYNKIDPYPTDTVVVFCIRAVSLTGYVQTSSNYSYTVKEHLIPSFSEIKRDPTLPKFDEDVTISLRIFDLLDIDYSYLCYQFNQSSPTLVPLDYNQTTNSYSAIIPRTNNFHTLVTYWVEATNILGHTGVSRKDYYVTVGESPYLWEIWTDPSNATENLDLTFQCSLFYRCEIYSSKIYYQINSGNIYSLSLFQTDDIIWTSEPLQGFLLDGGDIIEYWEEFNYSIGSGYNIYPEQPTHYFKTVVEYNSPIISGIVINPSLIRKGDSVSINVTVTDQSVLYVDCIVSIPGITSDSSFTLTNIETTNIWTCTVPTEFLVENESVVLTITAIDINGESCISYSGFFINDGSPPVLYGIKDLREEQICHTYEQTLYVYVNDTSQLNYVKLHLWISNGSQYYDEFLMIKGGDHLYYYTLNTTPFDLSPLTWVTYRFEAQDIHGYTTNSPEHSFFIGDHTGPSFQDFNSPPIIGYLDNPNLEVKIDDLGGSGVQSVSLIYSDNGWMTNFSLSLCYVGDYWWSITDIPTLDLNVTREYCFSALDWYGNPSQSFLFNYSTIDIHPPENIDWQLNDVEPIIDTTSNIHVELWLEDPSGIVLTNVNFTFYSLKENQHYKFTLTSVTNGYFHFYVDYAWIAHDYISYYFESEDLLGSSGSSQTYYFTVGDISVPDINPNLSYQGDAWKSIHSLDKDPNNVYSDAWLIDFQHDFTITATVTDETLVEVRLYYGSDTSYSNYLTMIHIGGNSFEVILTSSILTDLYISSVNPSLTHEMLFLKIWAEDNASHISEFYLWNDDSTCFEIYDYTSPLLSNFVIPSSALTGTYPTFELDAADYKTIDVAQLRFSYESTTTTWYDMTLISGDYFDGTWEFSNWQIPYSYDGVISIEFQFIDGDGLIYNLGYWCHKDTDSQSTIDISHSFTAIDSVIPTINNHYVNPSNPEYNEVFRFYVDSVDDCSGIDQIWIEWWKNDVKQTNLNLFNYVDSIYRTDFIGSFSYNTKIQYIVHATDFRGNEATTSQLTFYIEDTVIPVISNVYHSPSPISDLTNYVTVYATVTDSGAGINHVTVKYYRNGYYQNNRYMTLSNGEWSYSIYVGNWNIGDQLKYKIYSYDCAGNSKVTGLYGPFTISDTTPPSISSISRSPSSVYTNDLVTVSATVTDSGSGLNYVRLYHRHTPSGSWSYSYMSYSSGKYYGSFNAFGLAGITDYYYILAKDNSYNYKQSSTYSYTVQQSSGGGGWFQPSMEGQIDTLDILTTYDEGFLIIDKAYLSNIPSNLISSITICYQSLGEPTWHRIYAKDSSSFFFGYIASNTSLQVSFYLEVNLRDENVLISEIYSIELVDLTAPLVYCTYEPFVPNFNDELFFDIFVFDSSGIQEVKCYTSNGTKYSIHSLFEKESNKYSCVHRLQETIRIYFEVIDNNGHSSYSCLFEFIVFNFDESSMMNNNSNWTYLSIYLICGGAMIGVLSLLISKNLKIGGKKNE